MYPKNASLTRLIRCPGCHKKTRYDETNKFRPFCSERCKNADIVSWAEEKYHIPGPATAEAPVDSSQSDSSEDEDLEY